jgi:hypothetical protein
MSATSDVQICSNALLLLGQRPISSLTDTAGTAGDSVVLASNLWPMLRTAVLRSHPWNCAMKRVALSPDAVAPAFDWTYAFTLPGDNLRVWSIGQDNDSPDWFIENGKILMDDAICYLRYLFDNTDATTYDALLTLAMTSGMAATMAYGITKSQTQQDAMLKLHQFHLKQARTVDGMEGTGEESEVSLLIQARGR